MNDILNSWTNTSSRTNGMAFGAGFNFRFSWHYGGICWWVYWRRFRLRMPSEAECIELVWPTFAKQWYAIQILASEKPWPDPRHTLCIPSNPITVQSHSTFLSHFAFSASGIHFQMAFYWIHTITIERFIILMMIGRFTYDSPNGSFITAIIMRMIKTMSNVSIQRCNGDTKTRTHTNLHCTECIYAIGVLSIKVHNALPSSKIMMAGN